jgi:energy-coupling factor transporter ATP-binding protein EcfA2
MKNYMFCYKDMLVLNSKYNKSTNILYDEEDCSDYIINQSAKDVLSVLFKINYHNSIALIGPFGCGKSSLLLYVNTILSQDKNAEKCLKILKVTDKSLFNQFAIFIKDKIFFRIKIVGEYNSFKSQFKNTILQYKHLKNTNRYLKKDKTFQISKALELLDKDLKINKYSDILFSIDEFGKFIEYGLDNKNSNDIFDLQTLSEYINKKNI